MKFVAFLIISFIILANIVSAFGILSSPKAEVNLTNWRELRRKKRFILFEHAGVSKFVTSYAHVLDLGDKIDWRQLTIAYNFHYQFNVPSKPIHWWDRWNNRNLANDPAKTSETLQYYKDKVQEFIYQFAENLMERWGMQGRACVQRSICENAQIQLNQGLYAEILHRILQPQRNLNLTYTEAWRLGKKGLDCRAVYPEATKCLLDDYVHVREDFQQQHVVLAPRRT